MTKLIILLFLIISFDQVLSHDCDNCVEQIRIAIGYCQLPEFPAFLNCIEEYVAQHPGDHYICDACICFVLELIDQDYGYNWKCKIDLE